MTDENSGNEEKTVVDIAVQRMREENLELKAQLKAATDALNRVTKERDESRAFLEKNERGEAIDALKKMGCTYSIETFDNMSLDELDQLRQHYKYFKPPTFKSGADVSGRGKPSVASLDDLYVSLEERRKK